MLQIRLAAVKGWQRNPAPQAQSRGGHIQVEATVHKRRPANLPYPALLLLLGLPPGAIGAPA